MDDQRSPVDGPWKRLPERILLVVERHHGIDSSVALHREQAALLNVVLYGVARRVILMPLVNTARVQDLAASCTTLQALSKSAMVARRMAPPCGRGVEAHSHLQAVREPAIDERGARLSAFDAKAKTRV